MDAAQLELERIAAPKEANSDATALARYFVALGLNVQTDAVNRLLGLLAVLVIECGGGLALAVGMLLSEHREQVFANRCSLNSRPCVRLRSVRTHGTPAKKDLERVPNVRRRWW
jgi:hypothetical protein